jgi:MscS family membrane protein
MGGRRLRVAALVLVGLVLGCVESAAAQRVGLLRPASTDSAEPAQTAPDSPRAMLLAFRRAARRADWNAAAATLALSTPDERARGAELAERLSLVLSRRLAVDPDSMSPAAIGDTTDGLDATRERVGEFEGADGQPARVRLERIRDRGEARWVFSAATVAEIDGWYAALDGSWLRDRLPAALKRLGPLDVPWWQWIALLALLPVLALASWIIGGALRTLLGRLARRTTTTWDDALLLALSAPFRLWVAASLARPVLAALTLDSGVLGMVDSAARGAAWIAFFWAGLRAISLMQARLAASTRLASAGHTRAMIPLAGRVLRVTFVVLAVLMALSQFGYPVGTLLAGLGIGGIALALAAQKTVEHLFGSLSLAADRTFGVGDFVRVDGIEGTVETIGLRSTQIRTADRTLIKFPNGRLADLRIETFGERDRIRFVASFSLDVVMPAEVVRTILADIETLLRGHPLIWPDQVLVHVQAFGDATLSCRATCWFQTADAIVFEGIRSEMLLGIMQAVERRGSTLAVPTRAVRMASEATSPRELRAAAASE